MARYGLIFMLAVAILLASCVDRGAKQQAATAAPAQEPAQVPAQAQPKTVAARWTGDAVNFSFTTADGQTKTADSYAGKPLVLNFWAAW